MVCMQIMFGSEEVIEDYPLNPNTAAGLYVCYVIRKQLKLVEGKREKSDRVETITHRRTKENIK